MFEEGRAVLKAAQRPTVWQFPPFLPQSGRLRADRSMKSAALESQTWDKGSESQRSLMKAECV